MARLKNINPLGTIDLPLIGRTLGPGEEFDVDDSDAADALLRQNDNYEIAATKAGKNTPQEG